MQRNTKINRKRLGHTVNVRMDEDLHKKLLTRAEVMNMTTPGLNVTVSDVIRSMLIGLFDEISRDQPGRPAVREARRLKQQAERLVAETAAEAAKAQLEKQRPEDQQKGLMGEAGTPVQASN